MLRRGAEFFQGATASLLQRHRQQTRTAEAMDLKPRASIMLSTGTYQNDLMPRIGSHFRDDSGLYVVRIMNAPAWPDLDFIEVIYDGRLDIWHAGTHLNAYVKPNDQIDRGMWSITVKEDDDSSRWGSKEEFLNELNRVLQHLDERPKPLHQLPLTGIEALER